MGVSKQAAQKRFVPRGVGGLVPEGEQLFSRFTPRARNVLAAAGRLAGDQAVGAAHSTQLLCGVASWVARGVFIGENGYEQLVESNFHMGVQQFEQEVKAEDGLEDHLVSGIGEHLPLAHDLDDVADDLVVVDHGAQEGHFGLYVPESCPEVPSDVLDPRSTWSDKKGYDETARDVAKRFEGNFVQFESHVDDAVKKIAIRAAA